MRRFLTSLTPRFDGKDPDSKTNTSKQEEEPSWAKQLNSNLEKLTGLLGDNKENNQQSTQTIPIPNPNNNQQQQQQQTQQPTNNQQAASSTGEQQPAAGEATKKKSFLSWLM